MTPKIAIHEVFCARALWRGSFIDAKRLHEIFALLA